MGVRDQHQPKIEEEDLLADMCVLVGWVQNNLRAYGVRV